MIQHLLLLVVIAPLLVAAAPLIPVMVGITEMGSQARQKAESRACLLPSWKMAATTCHLMRAPDHRNVGVALASSL